ncbi:MAG: GNAT family N-acetyltransferase [Synergistaceae bacterium]|nr:GNAT family N-acetyltransferase [Synergistaceae bacterium]
MAALETSRTISFGKEGFALATGTNSASDNWAFFPSRALEEKNVKRVCSFFEDMKLPFIWPLFPKAAAARRILEDAGMFTPGELLVMSRPAFSPEINDVPASLTFEKNKKNDVWAETAWTAFGSPPGAPVSLVNLARGLGNSDGFFLILAKIDGIPVGTAMLAISGGSAGIYYFAAMPGERRKGVGKAMLREAARLAIEQGRDVLTLQATPSGVPFYASQGFKPLFRLPLYSFSEEVF